MLRLALVLTLSFIQPLVFTFKKADGDRTDPAIGCTTTALATSPPLWLTAAHCVLDDPDTPLTEVRYQIAGQHAVVWQIDADKDLALLLVPMVTDVQRVKLSRWAPRAGDDIEVIGHPLQFEFPILTRGVVSNPKTLRPGVEGPEVAIYDISICGGSSGSGVLNKNGELIGMIRFGTGSFGPCYPLAGGPTFQDLQGFIRRYFR